MIIKLFYLFKPESLLYVYVGMKPCLSVLIRESEMCFQGWWRTECVLLSFHLLNVQSQQRRLIDTRSCCGEHAMGIQHSMEEDSEEPSCSAKMYCIIQ